MNTEEITKEHLSKDSDLKIKKLEKLLQRSKERDEAKDWLEKDRIMRDHIRSMNDISRWEKERQWKGKHETVL